MDWNHQRIPFFSEPPELHAAHVPSTIPGSGGQVAPGAETTGQAQIVSALGTPFVLEGLFGEADAEAMDAEPDLEPATDVMSMDVEGDAEGAAATAEGGMIIDDDSGAKNNTSIGTSRDHDPDMTNTDANANAIARRAPGAQGSQI
jgi:hypothetical protein